MSTTTPYAYRLLSDKWQIHESGTLVHVAYVADEGEAKQTVALLNEGRTARQALADAAREINCAGPVADRIRVMKAEHGRQFLAMESMLEKARAFAEKVIETQRHDKDAHEHGTDCLVCEAERVLSETSAAAYREAKARQEGNKQ